MYYLSVFSVLLPLLIGIILFKNLEVNSRLMLILLAFASISQLSSYFLAKGHVWIFYNLYTIIDSVVWAYIFFRNSKRTAIKISIFTIVLFQLTGALYSFISKGIEIKFFSEFVCLNSILQILWVLSFFYERYISEQVIALERDPMFWYCIGILIYAPTTYFLFAFYDIVQVEKKYANLWSIHHVLNVCMYFIFSIGILINVMRNSKYRNVFSRNKS